MGTFRKVAFYLFAAVYLILCPLTILYALGYLFKPGAELEMVKTGLISLATEPPGAAVYIGKARYSGKTPAVIRDLLPGSYPVRVLLKGYKPWTRTVSLEAGKSAAFEKILLVPKEWRPQELSEEPFQELIDLPGNPFFLVRKGVGAEDLFIFDVHSELLSRVQEDSPLFVKEPLLEDPLERVDPSYRTAIQAFLSGLSGVRGFAFDARGQRLLFWQKNRMGILDFSREQQEEEFSRLMWIRPARSGEIEQAFWVYEGSHILFRTREEVSLLSLEAAGQPARDSLPPVKKGASIAYREESGRLYYLDPSTGRLWSLQILPKRKLLP